MRIAPSVAETSRFPDLETVLVRRDRNEVKQMSRVSFNELTVWHSDRKRAGCGIFCCQPR